MANRFAEVACLDAEADSGPSLARLVRGGWRPHLQTLLLFTLSTILVSTSSAYPRSTHGLAALPLGLAAFTSALYKEYRKPLNLVEQVFEGGTFLACMAALLNYVATYAITILYSNFLQVEAGLRALQLA